MPQPPLALDSGRRALAILRQHCEERDDHYGRIKRLDGRIASLLTVIAEDHPEHSAAAREAAGLASDSAGSMLAPAASWPGWTDAVRVVVADAATASEED